ncbi:MULTISPECIES: GOLPH3/VPS74 family protein [Actinoalloteichus]|uniref:Golgi phosphoprotein 3 (GPP34) n=1 Tax=Actinoalloteichus fjordicus TaxID=1612552 RepID=A0AAC9LGW7_9PSEU|nr:MULTISPECIES: GPP34 family phosphoprotein [Actinoalloteichus]APU16650.1 Golgi phosphoprotein 3 (GPP34) [Actinoalloteichus fjordicus]APU22716.1 Golgi phosphoprotein 3 (GPP34) [Actinoalloteichus sp. GBA129-24]
MDLPHTLAARLYLLACDVDRERLMHRSRLGLVLRAAALDDLLRRGLLTTDSRGRPAVAGTGRTGDPLFDEVLGAVAAGKPRPWRAWVTERAKAAVGQTGRSLADDGMVRQSSRRALLLFPVRRVRVSHPEVVGELRRRVRRILHGSVRVQQLDRRDAAMVSLAAEGRLAGVFHPESLGSHDVLLRKLRARVGPVAWALRGAVEARRRSSGGGDGGVGGDSGHGGDGGWGDSGGGDGGGGGGGE